MLSTAELKKLATGNEHIMARVQAIAAQELKQRVSQEVVEEKILKTKQGQIAAQLGSLGATKETHIATQALASITDKIGDSMSRFIKMGAYRLMTQTWRDAKNFAMEYNTALNEIRIVTGMT